MLVKGITAPFKVLSESMIAATTPSSKSAQAYWRNTESRSLRSGQRNDTQRWRSHIT